MAILKDTTVSGNLRVTDSVIAEKVQTKVINAPTTSGGSTYGPGSNGQVLKSNGTTTYWASDNNSVTGVKGNAESSYRTGQVNLTSANVGAVAVSQGTGNAGKFLMVNSSGNVEATTVTTQAAKTWTPTTSNQTIASGTYITGTQTIAGDADLTAANIKKGVGIFGVTGTFTTTPSGKTALTATALRDGYAGFINGSQVNGSMPNATFANTGTSGKTYTDISSTAPVLVAGDYLYINEGYTPYSKISLSKLVPDGSDVKGHNEYILSGHSAYDNDGTLVAGSVPALASTDITVNGATVTIPVGKHTGESGATAVTKTIDSGTVSTTFAADGMSIYFDAGTSSNKNVTITPKYTNTAGYVAAHSTATNNGGTTYYKIKAVNGSIGGSASGGSATAAISNVNSMATISDVTGKTAGTDYWTVKATATGSAGSYTPKYTVTTSGWLVSTVTGTAQTVSVSSDSTGKSINIPKATFDKSGSGVYCKTAGYIPAGTTSSPVATIGNGTVVASVSSNSNGSASMAATGFTALASGTSDYYVTLSTSPGSVKAKATGGTAGYVTSSTTNETAATNVTVSGDGNKLYIPAGGYAGSVSSHSITTTPVVTGALSGTGTNIGTTTKPSGTDGTDYWTFTPGGSVTKTGVSTAKGKATISTAGYIPTGNNESSASTVNITPTASNGTARYLTKATTSTSNGTATATAGTASTSVTGMVTTSTNTGYSVSASATGGNASVTASSATVGAGYNPSSVTASTTAKSATGTSASDTKYIQKGVLLATVSSNSNGSASMAAKGFTAASSATTHYVLLATSPGNVKAKASVNTEGYVKSETAETSGTSVSVSGDGNKLYIPDGSVTASVSSNSAGSASMAATGFTASSSSTNYYVTLSTSPGSVKAKATGGAGYVTSSTTNETAATNVTVSGNGHRLYIPAGSASSNLTYSGATISTTNNSGVSVTPRHSVTKGYIPDATNVNGTTQYINGVTITAPSSGTRSFSITVPNGSSDTIAFVFNVDSSGNVTVTNP